MANWTAHDTNTSTGDDPATFAATVKANAELNRNNFLDSSPPASPVEGQIWADNTSSTRFVVKLYQNSSWVVLTDKIAEGARDHDGNEIQNVHLEEKATGSVPAASAGNDSRILWDSTLDYIVTMNASTRWYGARARMDGTTYMAVTCDLHVAAVGTPATEDAATEMGGWTINQATEELVVSAKDPIPTGFTGAHDLILAVQCLLLNAETANDDIDMDGVWISLTPASGDGASKTETGFAAVTQDIGSNNSQYDLHEVQLTVDHDDATNPVAAGDIFRATINHDSTGQVAGVIVVAATLWVPVYNFAGYES